MHLQARVRKFSGLYLTTIGIEENSEKSEEIIKMKTPTIKKGTMNPKKMSITLNRFISSRSLERHKRKPGKV